jgi:AcrR family transcriptional regulator
VARQKEFDPDIALDRAMSLFRSSGYEAVSTAELCNAMGIARQSMYDTFGDKAALYEAALRRYQSASRVASPRSPRSSTWWPTCQRASGETVACW